MDLIQIIVVLIVVGVLMWLVNSYLPIAEPFKKIINVIVIIFVVIWLLNVFGLLSGLSSIHVGHH
jgi:hypothetical protein